MDIFSKISDILNTMPSSKISTSNSASILAVNSAKSNESKPESLFRSAFANIFIVIFIILIGVSNSLFYSIRMFYLSNVLRIGLVNR